MKNITINWLTTTGIQMIIKGKSENKYAGSEAPNW